MLDVENTVSNDKRKPLGSGADRLIGDDKPNTIFATRGPDVIVGRGGSDELFGNSGRDVIRAVDGERDKTVDCGGGKDKVFLDPQDEVADNCERIIVRR